MRLKEIKQGMVIHCKTKEEMEELSEELSKNIEFMVDGDHIWNYGNDGLRRNCISLDNDGKYLSFDTYEYFVRQGMKITEFSDLILPELTAEEVLEICHKICGEAKGHCASCRLKKCCYRDKNIDYSETLDILKQWKSEHEKKEPEVEWVYRVFGAENFGEKFFNTEEEAIARCEELVKTQKNRQYARYERVCRVKE